MNQESLMRFDPAFRTEKPYPSHAAQYRSYHGDIAWLYNPWTGTPRHPSDIGSDPFGLLIAESQRRFVGSELAQRVDGRE